MLESMFEVNLIKNNANWIGIRWMFWMDYVRENYRGEESVKIDD